MNQLHCERATGIFSSLKCRDATEGGEVTSGVFWQAEHDPFSFTIGLIQVSEPCTGGSGNIPQRVRPITSTHCWGRRWRPWGKSWGKGGSRDSNTLSLCLDIGSATATLWERYRASPGCRQELGSVPGAASSMGSSCPVRSWDKCLPFPSKRYTRAAASTASQWNRFLFCQEC